MKKSPRTPKNESEYNKWLAENKGNPCAFCNLPNRQIIKVYDSFVVAKNRFPYENFFGNKVTNHIMIVPKRHVEQFLELSKKEIVEYIKIISEYDKKGYSSHTKSIFDPGRSIKHFHTHLFEMVD